MQTTKLFHPLTGIELKAVIDKDFADIVTGQNPILLPHLTHGETTYKVTLEIQSYPMQNPEITVFERSLGTTQESAPDAIRQATGLPTLETTQTETGAHVDSEKPIATSVTVGGGTRPRGRPRKVAIQAEPLAVPAEPADSDNLIGDDGEPIRLNSF